MTDALLKPPARFSHALLLALVLGVAGLLAASIGHLPTLAFALVTLVVFLAGFWAFSRGRWVYTAVGTIAVVLGAFLIPLTAFWALIGAVSAPSGGGILLSLAVAFGIVAGVVAVVGDLVPSRVTDQDGPAVVAWLYTAGIATGVCIAIVGVQLGLTSLFGESISSLVSQTGDLAFDTTTRNPITGMGSLALLVGAGLWYATRLLALPLGRRFRRGVAVRLTMLADQGQGAGSGDGVDGGEPGDEPEATTTDSLSDEPTITALLGLGAGWAKVPRFVGAGLFYLGLGAFVAGVTPELQPVATDQPVAQTIGGILGSSSGPQRSLVTVLSVLVVLRLGHAVAWRGINVNWTANERRLGYGIGSLLAVLGAGLWGREVVRFLLATPALQFVPMGESGPVVVATSSGVRFTEVGSTGITFAPQPAVFPGWFDGLVDLLGPSVFGFGLLAVVILLSLAVLVVSTMAVAGARLTRPGAGIGLLFVSAAGAAVLGAGGLVAFTAGAGALLAWELYTYGGSLRRQLDPGASTVTAELVHLAASAGVIGVAVAVTLAGARAVRHVPTAGAPWQVFGALLLSVTALSLGLLYLGLRGEGQRAVGDAARPDGR